MEAAFSRVPSQFSFHGRIHHHANPRDKVYSLSFLSTPLSVPSTALFLQLPRVFLISPSWCLSTSYFGRQIYWTSPFCRHYYILSCAVKSFYILKNRLKESQMQTDTHFIEQHKGFLFLI